MAETSKRVGESAPLKHVWFVEHALSQKPIADMDLESLDATVNDRDAAFARAQTQTAIIPTLNQPGRISED
ncbi:unnamed protein product [Fusarium venenatum]|uniref:Uncharacterized protein n=1 Tax=Fusarium venenatum TaxID=56646 RepID=A0A2L2TWU0_9HYPO|nr:uncharacterized protein FVRRES_10554 [Fusarium venenatum]CEI70477.1 unnamed protein product [Fusarium venenatum]